MRNTKSVVLYSTAVSALLVALACAVNPVTGKKQMTLISEAQEIQIGEEGAKQVAAQFVRQPDEPLQTYINGVGQKVAKVSHRPNLKYHYTVLDTGVVNAFALPGGYIYINRGMLEMMNSEEELAGVLGHETGHVAARHSVQQISQSQFYGVLGTLATVAAGPRAGGQVQQLAQLGIQVALRGHSRKDEYQADELGVLYADRAAYNPDGARRMLSMLERLYPAQPAAMERLFQTHPPAAERVARVSGQLQKLPPADLKRPFHRNSYLRQLDGLVYGPSLQAGLIRSGRYYNANWEVQLRAPENWNSDTEAEGALLKLDSKNEQHPAAVQLVGQAGEKADDETLGAFFQRIGAQNPEVHAVTLAGLSGRVADFTIPRENAAPLLFRGWFLQRNSDMLMLLAYSSDAEGLRNAIAIAGDMQRLSPAEISNIVVDRLRVKTAAKATTPEALAKLTLSAEGDIGIEAMRLLNGWSAGEAIPGGTLYKMPPPSMIERLRKSHNNPPAKPEPSNQISNDTSGE